MRRCVVRKIKNGKVKIANVWYAPYALHRIYDGRLDGMRYLFGRYDTPEYVNLHSPVPDGEFGKTPDCVEGEYPWSFWYRTIQ